MKLQVNWNCYAEPLCDWDVLFLKYIWKCSDGFEASICCKDIPQYLRETMFFKGIGQRLLFYKEKLKIIDGFEYREDTQTYYVILKPYFADGINAWIRKEVINEEPIQTNDMGGNVIVNNQIVCTGDVHGTLVAQIGMKNESCVKSHSYSAEEIRNLLEYLLKEFNSISIEKDEDVTNEIVDNLSDAIEELDKQTPRKVKFRKVISSIGHFIEKYGAIAGGMAIIGEHIQKLEFLISML